MSERGRFTPVLCVAVALLAAGAHASGITPASDRIQLLLPGLSMRVVCGGPLGDEHTSVTPSGGCSKHAVQQPYGAR